MKWLCFAGGILAACTPAAHAQQPSIEIWKVHTITDRDGRGFTGLPRHFTALPRGRFLVMDGTNSPRSPALIDSSGKFLKVLGPVGQGPGELAGESGPFHVGAGDTTFVLTLGQIQTYAPDLSFVRAVRPATGAFQFILTPTGFVVARGQGSAGSWTSFHVVDRAGKALKSFGKDTARYPTEYLLARSNDGFWAASRFGHRLERWTLDGSLKQVIDSKPGWWRQINPRAPDPFTTVRSVREVGGVLWVLSMVPVPNIKEVMRAAGQRPMSDGGGPPAPMDKMYTAVLEAFDVASGKQITERAIAATGVTLLDDRHFVLHTLSSDDLPQLEIWEMKLKR